MIDLASLRRHFDPAFYERGERYRREGRIKPSQAQAKPDGSVHMVAKVRGSQRAPYEVDIKMKRSGSTVTSVTGYCDCPVGYNCKHVVAAVLSWAEGENPWSAPASALPLPPPAPAEPQPSPAIHNLLSRLHEAAERDGGDVYPDTVRKRLLYVLRLDERPDGRDTMVRVVSATLRKDGDFANDEKAYAVSNFRNLTSAKFITPNDHAILGALERTLPFSIDASRGQALRGDWAVALVDRMLRTGRLYWQDYRTAKPLRQGPGRRGSARWVTDAQGRQRFTLALDSASAVVLPTTPPLYVDPESGECGAVEADVTPHLAATLLAAPPLAPGDVPAFRAAAEPLRARLPVLPEPPARTETRRVRPHPVLTLRSARMSYGYGYGFGYGIAPAATLPVAELEFDYAGFRVGPNRPPTPLEWMDGGALVTVERRPDEEAKAAERLYEAGLNRSNLLLTLADGRPPTRDLFVYPSGMLEDPTDWLHFCHIDVPALRASGWTVDVAPDFPFEVVDAPKDWAFEIGDGSGIDWFGVALGVEVDGQRVDLLPALRTIIAALHTIPPEAFEGEDDGFDPDVYDDEYDDGAYDEEDAPDDEAAERPAASDWLDTVMEAVAPEGVLFVPFGDGRFLPLEAERLKPLVGVLMELFGLQPEGGDARIGRTHLGDLAALEEAATSAGIPLLGAESVRTMARALRDSGGIPAVPPPAGLRADLRPYQQAGLDWLQFLGVHGFGGILADDMGLGKTVQALAHLLAEKEAGRLDRPCLLVAPTSVLGNWRAEVARFAPGLRTLVLHGPQRKAAHGALSEHDLVVTSYALLPRDREILAARPWHLAIFDEAQYLKNPTAQATKAALALDARQRLCLTGTPVENSLDELWSLFSVAVPSLLGDRTGFRRQFRTPIEKHGNTERQRLLARRVRPFLLRRTKEEVASELPPKTEILESVEPQAAQRDLYETIRLAMDARVREEIARKGLARSRISILDALLKLRQVCCDPRLVKLESARTRVAKGAASAKLGRLLEMVPELLADGRRILLFSQFTSMLDLIKPELEERGIPFVELTGDTRDRETPVRRFQAGDVPVFLISLKAGGTGLNLTAADTVIHYDPWWNPAVEDQATDRAHRIGQDKPVFVYKLVTIGTVEERMIQLQERKRRLGEAVHGEAGTEADLLTPEDVDFLLAPIDA
ncbi:SNF2-related protein [Brevundimonas sp.]|uniref:SNF2-related protein n=1 Tax=Brevundimonas sp. TaxID=1871086 RepID=UPI002D316995|nr:SNF2-related protein [Brevundimonas sp.]HYD26418.1 SNF2-related protein [Brevundimonas sp.]